MEQQTQSGIKLTSFSFEVPGVKKPGPEVTAARNVQHVIKRESTGHGMSDSTTPVCTCGWRGIPCFEYDDYMSTNLRDQERAHMDGGLA